MQKSCVLRFILRPSFFQVSIVLPVPAVNHKGKETRMSIRKYSKDSLIGADGRFHYVGKKIAGEYNKSVWREEYYERKRIAPVKRTGADGKLLDFDDNASSRECSMELMIETGGVQHFGCVESFEDAVLDRYEKNERIEILNSFIPSLSKNERDTLYGMAMGISPDEFQKEFGVPKRTYSYRRAKLAEKLRNMVLKEQDKRAAVRAEASR